MRGAGRVAAAALALAVLAAAPAVVVSGKPAPARHASLRASSSSPRVSVLAYHAIADLGHDEALAKYSVPPARFAEQLDFLLRKEWSFVDLDTVLAAFADEARLPDRALLVTFDDAYDDLLHAALPILSERGIPAVAFAVADEIGGTNSWDRVNGSTELSLLDPDGLRTVARQGIEIGAHSATHPRLPDLSERELEREVMGAARMIEEAGLRRPRAFAYPFGHWSQAVATAVAEAGYEVAFTVERGVVENGVSRYALPRLAVHSDDTGRGLHLKLWARMLPRPLRAVLDKVRGG